MAWRDLVEKVRVKAGFSAKLLMNGLKQAMIPGSPGISQCLRLKRLNIWGLALKRACAGHGGSWRGRLMRCCVAGGLRHEAAAATGRIDEAGAFFKTGRRELVDRAEVAEVIARPLESERWAGRIDNAGGEMLHVLSGR